MIVYGSHALRAGYKARGMELGREPADLDILASREEARDFIGIEIAPGGRQRLRLVQRVTVREIQAEMEVNRLVFFDPRPHEEMIIREENRQAIFR